MNEDVMGQAWVTASSVTQAWLILYPLHSSLNAVGTERVGGVTEGDFESISPNSRCTGLHEPSLTAYAISKYI